MSKKIGQKIGLLFFLLASLTEAYIAYIEDVEMETIIKPFIVISLFIYYLLNAQKINKLYVLALFFSVLGDSFLLNMDYFFWGVSSFLIAHLIFIKITLDYIGKISLKVTLVPLFFFLLFSIIIIFLIKDNLTVPLLLIGGYGLVLSVFATLSFLNYLKLSSKSNSLLFFGAFLFIVVNSLVALNTFFDMINFSNAITMAFYSVAQYLVCLAILKKDSAK